MTEPAQHSPASHLHRRLTVVYANGADRSRVAEVLGRERGTLIARAEDLAPVLEQLAIERAPSRLALRACLDTVAARTMQDCDLARQDVERLVNRRRTTLQGAEWATELQAGLPAQLAAVEAARDALDRRRVEQRVAQQELDKVLEQRKAAASAIEQADQELREMAGLGMDEGGLRRELEAAGEAVRAAGVRHTEALARLEELQLERAAAEPHLEPLPADLAAVTAVREALDGLDLGTGTGITDPRAMALAGDWERLVSDLRQLGAPVVDEGEAELAEVERRVEAATRKLAELDAAKAEHALTPDQRTALDEAHAAVQEAEEQVARRRSAGPRKRLARAQAAERALLDDHGFGSYLEVVLTGGRVAAAIDPVRTDLERELFAASRAREALERQLHPTPELTELRAKQVELLARTTQLLGVDPGDRAVALLKVHQAVDAGAQGRLSDALAGVGIVPVGVSLVDAAEAFLTAHPLPDATPGAASEQEREEQQAHREAVEASLAAAQAEVDASAEALHMAERSVETFEAELSSRSEADVQRMERFVAAEQLRSQIAAVAGTLRRAESQTRENLEQVNQQVTAAEVAFEQIAAEVAAHAQHGREVAEELPVDERPDGDPLRNLATLAERLRARVSTIDAAIEAAEAASEAAATQMEDAMRSRREAGTGEGPMVEDYVDVLEQLFEASTEVGVVVLDEPFGELDDASRTAVLATVRGAAVDRQIVLMTEDPDVLGWAIDLPAEEGAADPADALLARLIGPEVHEDVNLDAPSVDVTTNTDVPETTIVPAGRRWAGQR